MAKSSKPRSGVPVDNRGCDRDVCRAWLANAMGYSMNSSHYYKGAKPSSSNSSGSQSSSHSSPNSRAMSLINTVKSSASYSFAQIQHTAHDLQSFWRRSAPYNPRGDGRSSSSTSTRSASSTPSSSSSISWRRTSRVRPPLPFLVHASEG